MIVFGSGFQPRVSVVICTYNRASSLGAAIESVFAQDFTDWELLIVDDGSTDQTHAVVATHVRRDPRVRALFHQNRRLPMSRNLALLACATDVVTFLDSDDAFKPHHLSSRWALWQQAPVDFIEGGIDVEGDVMIPDAYEPTRLVSLYDCVTGPTFFGRRQAFLALDGFRDLPWAEDTEFWSRAEQRYRCLRIREPQTYIKRQISHSMTGDAIRARSTLRPLPLPDQPSTTVLPRTSGASGGY